jgi:hypothetical protein
MRSLPGPLTAGFSKHSSGFYPLGQYSDDTQEACAVAEAIIESGGVDGQIVPLVLKLDDGGQNDPKKSAAARTERWVTSAIDCVATLIDKLSGRSLAPLQVSQGSSKVKSSSSAEPGVIA